MATHTNIAQLNHNMVSFLLYPSDYIVHLVNLFIVAKHT